VRPNIAGSYKIKFKAEALPLKDQLGGYRLLYSHNVELNLSQVPDLDHISLPKLGEIFPCLADLKKFKTEKVEYVNHTIVEEVLQDLGTLDFGKDLTAGCNLALWRERGMQKPLCGEFALIATLRATRTRIPSCSSSISVSPVSSRMPASARMRPSSSCGRLDWGLEVFLNAMINPVAWSR